MLFKIFANRGSAARRALCILPVALAAALPLTLANPVLARTPDVVLDAFEAGDTLTGNYLAAIAAGANSDTRAAAVYFREVLRRDPKNAAVVERAFIASLSNGDMTEAFAIAEQIIKRDGRNGLARMALGVRAIKQKRFATARTHFTRGRINNANDVTGSLLVAWTHAGSGDFTKAIAAVESLSEPVVKLFRDYHHALINDVSGKPELARERMQAAYDSEKTTLRLVQSYASLQSRLGARNQAIEAFRAFDALLPRHPLVVDAISQLEAGKTLPPPVANAIDGAAEVLYGLGSANTRRGQELVPMIYLRLAIYLQPENSLAIITLADIYDRLKQYERAIEVYQLMPVSSPLKPNAELQIGLTLETLERKDEAKTYLQAIADQRPNDAEALLALANLYRSRKEYQRAVELYTKVLEQAKPGDRGAWSTYYFRAVAYERLKNWPPAEADFKKSLELFPDQPSVLNYLGYSWVDRHMNLDEAFKMLRRAVELRPQDGYIVDSLGWAYYRLGKYEDALRELEKAIALRPADPTINDHLGDVYWKVGRKLEAGFQWNHARDLKPEADDLPRILRKIELGLDAVEKEEAAKKAGDNKSGSTDHVQATGATGDKPEPAKLEPAKPEPANPDTPAPARDGN